MDKLLTKDEIIQNEILETVNWGSGTEWVLVKIRKAMDIHAKQTAIGFAEWLLDNYYCDDVGYYKHENGCEVYTEPNQLYELYTSNLQTQ